VLYPDDEAGAAYDKAMQTEVFDPLGMSATTFDFVRALQGNHAAPHAPDIDGRTVAANMPVNYAVVPVRPAGGAWSNVTDMLRYVRMVEKGRLADGTRYVAEASLLARREQQAAIGEHGAYGMGLMIDRTWGVPVVHHGGSLIGYKSDMLWLPDHGVGAVILTNSDRGQLMLAPFRRRLLEVLFDGTPEPEAVAQVESAAAQQQAAIAAERERLAVPADPVEASKLGRRYRNPALGDIAIVRDGAAVTLDVGEWRSDLASRRNDDGTISFVTIAPGISGIQFVAAGEPAGRWLILRSAQQEYILEQIEPAR
jgi:CubicO group peptidase (beta-lactamase class C family)